MYECIVAGNQQQIKRSRASSKTVTHHKVYTLRFLRGSMHSLQYNHQEFRRSQEKSLHSQHECCKCLEEHQSCSSFEDCCCCQQALSGSFLRNICNIAGFRATRNPPCASSGSVRLNATL